MCGYGSAVTCSVHYSNRRAVVSMPSVVALSILYNCMDKEIVEATEGDEQDCCDEEKHEDQDAKRLAETEYQEWEAYVIMKVKL